MLLITAKNKYVYDWWKQIVTQLIEKDPGCPKLFFWQAIHLYEFYLKLLIGVYFLKLQQHVKDKNLLNDNCYGGYPNWQVIDPETDIAMVTRRPIKEYNNDLTQCFNQPNILLSSIKSTINPMNFPWLWKPIDINISKNQSTILGLSWASLIEVTVMLRKAVSLVPIKEASN